MKLRTSVVSGLLANETERMTPLETQKLFDDLYVVRDGFANVFLVRDGGGFIAIDAGIRAESIKEEMAKLAIDADDVKAVLITHSDIDHVNGIDAFPRAEIYLPEAELEMLGQYRISMTEQEFALADQRYSAFDSPEWKGLFGDSDYWPEDDYEIVQTPQGRVLSFLKNRLDKDFRVLRDAERLRFGDVHVDAVLVEGHTRGLTSYLVNDKYLFVGDALSLADGRVQPFNRFLNRDDARHLRSIGRIKAMAGVEFLFTQHYGYTGDVGNAFSSWQE